MSIHRILSLILILSMMMTTTCAYADNQYSYLYSNAAGKIYLVETDDGWSYQFFEGNSRMYCQKYAGANTQITLPTEVDGHPVFITNITLPYGQIERVDIPDYFDSITEELLGDVYCLKQGCVIAIHNADAYISLPNGTCETMGIKIAGYAGSTAQTYAESYGLPFELLDGNISSETPYVNVDAGHENGLSAAATGGRGMDVSITSNTEWHVRVIDGQNWISLSCDSGYGNGSFYTLIAENLDGSVREGWIEVEASGCEPINIKVTQGYEANNTTNEETTPSYESLLEGEPVIVASLGHIDTYKASGPYYNWLADLHLEVTYNGSSIYGTDTIQLINGTANQLIMKPLGDVSEILYIDVLKISEEDTLEQPRWIDSNCSLQNDGTYVFSFKDSVLSYRNMREGEVIATVKMNTGEYRRLILCNFKCDFSLVESDGRSTVDGIAVDIFYGENDSGEVFKGLMNDDGTYQSAVWISENYDAVANFDPKGFLGLFKDKIDSNYVVEIGKGRYVIKYAFSHILYLSPEDILSYSYFMDKETEIRGWYGLIYVLCSCVDIDITKYLPYEDFLMLLFDQNVHTEDTKIDFFAAAELVADYLIKVIGEKFKDNIVISILSDCKSFIRIDELSRAATKGGIIEVAKKWRDIIDVEALYTKIKEWGFKYETKSLLEYLGSAAEDVIGALSKSIEIGIKAGIALGGTGWQIKNKNAMQAFVQNNNAPIAIAFFYSPVHEEFQCYMFTTESCENEIDSLRVGAYDFSRVNNEKVGLENWDGLNMLYSPTHNSGTQKGFVSFDRELIWHMLLGYLS